MAEYRKILTGYVNPSKSGDGHYLVIKNVGEETIVIEPEGKIYLNRTPARILEQYPNVPHYSKDIKVEEEPLRDEHVDTTSNDQIPF